MKVIQSIRTLKQSVRIFKNKKQSIGFVPTLGYLHEGHLSLVRRAARENDRVVVSIFVNPLQFGPREDLARYPRDLARDIRLLRGEGVDVLFAPKTPQFYAKDFQTSVSVARLGRPLCGATRPTHFAGVATVVLKLLNLVAPDVLYLGQKDYQQFRVVEQMVRDLEVPVQVRCCPIVREKSGLAMSSRNIYLDAQERVQAASLKGALDIVETLVRQGVRSVGKLKQAMRKELSLATRARIDYAEIVDADTLLPVVQLRKGQKVEVALAVFFTQARLIDNRLMNIRR